jgi:hypothetical protein
MGLIRPSHRQLDLSQLVSRQLDSRQPEHNPLDRRLG